MSLDSTLHDVGKAKMPTAKSVPPIEIMYERAKRRFLNKAMGKGDGDLAEEWMKALRQLVEAEAIDRGKLPPNPDVGSAVYAAVFRELVDAGAHVSNAQIAAERASAKYGAKP